MSWLITIVAGFLPRPLAGVVVWAVIAIAVGGAALSVYEVIKHKGADEVRAKIEKDNTDAIHKGIDARMSFDDCIDAGGVYDFGRQRCTSPTLGPR